MNIIRRTVSRLFGRGKNAAEGKPQEESKGKSLIDHFNERNKLAGVLEALQGYKRLDRGELMRDVFQRTIATIKATTCDVKEGKATFQTGGAVWAFDSATQTPILRKEVDNENVSAIDNYKAFSNTSTNIPDEIYQFYSRGFITWTTCAQFAQHEIINRACAVRGEDAVAVGYKLAYADAEEGGKIADEDKDGKESPEEMASKQDFLTALEKQTKRMGIDEVMRKLDYNKCVYGIGIAIPSFSGEVDMSLPFNIDAKGLETYEGFAVVEPYWLCPMFSTKDASDPTSKHFFEPTWWRLPDGRMVHRSWCVKVVNSYVADILKPTYIYGGIPLTQMIYERVFAADKCANEAPMLALTKRLLVVDANIQQVIADPKHVKDLMDVVTYCRTNWGVMFKQAGSDINQIDTSLGEYDQLIMTQYQLVASIAQMPATKLLKVTPTGFQSTGEYEWKDWAQSLIDIQEMEFTPLLERHLQLLTKKRGKPVAITVKWNAVDAPTGKEKEEIQSMKATTRTAYLSAGAITIDEIRAVMRNDAEGEFTGLSAESPQKDSDLMSQLAKEMGGSPEGGGKNPNGAGDAGAPSADSVETGDDAEFESKHKRDESGKFTDTAGENFSNNPVAYLRKRGKKQYWTKGAKKGQHKYGGMVEPAVFKKFPPIKKTNEEKGVTNKHFASHYNGGKKDIDLTHFNEFAKKYKWNGDTECPENMRKTEFFARSNEPRFGITVDGKAKAKKGKPLFRWYLADRELDDKEAFALEHALVNGGMGAALGTRACKVQVKTSFASAKGNTVRYWDALSKARKPSAKFCCDAETRACLKSEKQKYLDSLLDRSDAVFERIKKDAMHPEKVTSITGEAEDFGVLAYFQYRTSFRCGSKEDNEDKGALDLTPENFKFGNDGWIHIEADTKNSHWVVDVKDKFLYDYLKEAIEVTPKGEKVFGHVKYNQYLKYLHNVGDDCGVYGSLGTHGMRHMAASRFAAQEVDKIKIDPKKHPDEYIAAICDVITRTGAFIGDEPKTAFTSYISPSALWHNAPWLLKKNPNFKAQA